VFSPLLNSTVTLDELGTFDVQRGLGSVQRENRERISKIIFNTAPNAKFTEVENQIRAVIDNYPIPAGYRLSLGGRSKRVNEQLDAFKIIMWLSAILVYMCIAALFESYTLPLVIMLAIPLAIVGVVWAYIFTGTQFDELAILGCAFLVGILPNSSILLVHFAGYLRREKQYPRQRAIMVSGYTRLRPIFMTVSTTILGLLPMAIKWQGDDEWVPFAVTVIGGLISSTVLTLLIVPGFYFIIEDIAGLFTRLFRYIASWRWVFIFWSAKQRRRVKQEVTAYRQKPPREEPLRVEIDHLTRIYAPNMQDRVGSKWNKIWQSLKPNPSMGFVPSPMAPRAPSISTQSRKKALDMISITMEQGLFGLLGPNGAGKTTLLRLIAGIDQPTRGYLSICGYDMKTEAKHARKQIGYLPQTFGVYSHMSARQYLDYFALLKGMKNRKQRQYAIDRALDMVNLQNKKTIPVGQFSGGMMRRIGLAQIFVQPPKVLIVDEPTVGLDPMERVRFRNLLSQLSQDRIVILSTHIVEDVAHSCKQLAIMDEGTIRTVGSPDNLIAGVQGKVWEILVPNQNEWRDYRHRYHVVSQSQTIRGLQMRIVAETPPMQEAKNVEPTLEDAYLYYTNIKPRSETQEGGIS
ncbi:ATP-binding cassette domain-containing protein, partial [bacterium]|nr:ATP-binding cassette domain-containing protein [bacterium]